MLGCFTLRCVLWCIWFRDGGHTQYRFHQILPTAMNITSYVPNDKPMKLIFLAPGDMQVARTERQCMVYFCGALQEIGIDVELVTMGIRVMESEPKVRHPLELYRIRTPPPVRIVRSLACQQSSDVWWALNRLFVHSSVALSVLLNRSAGRRVVFFTRNFGSAIMLAFLRQIFNRNARILFEIHRRPQNGFQRRVLQTVDGIVAQSYALASDLGPIIPGKPILGVHQGVDLEYFNSFRLAQNEARQAVGLPLNKDLIVYSGKLYWGYREVELILEAATQLTPKAEIVFVGGRADQVSQYRDQIDRAGRTNVRFVGFVPPSKVHFYNLAADILVSYYPPGIDLNQYRSPLKLFEYMAAGRAIVAADYPVLREILGTDEPVAVLAEPDNPLALAQAINSLLSNKARMINLGARALKRAEQFSWRERARAVAAFGQNLP